MKRTPVSVDWEQFPPELHPALGNAPLYDSSCSPEARVYYIQKDGGLFLKTAPGGRLRAEAEMTGFFHRKGLGPEVLAYLPGNQDWLLTRAVPGSDCTAEQYLADPRRLCDTLAQLLRQLHDQPKEGCPIPNRTDIYLQGVFQNMAAGHWNADLLPTAWPSLSREDARAEVEKNSPYLHADTLIHGDYCLPNILLQNWNFSGFIDLGCGGIGERHMDLFWGIWTLQFNLKNTDLCRRFLDAYGRERINPDALRTIAACETFG